MKLWKLLPLPIRELLEAPYRRETRIEIEQILRKNNNKNLNILDVGAGDCFAKKFFKNTGHSYVAIDLEPKRSEVKRGDAENLNFLDASFDIVFCLEVLEYVPGPEKALKEIFRVLRKSGKAIITTPLLAAGYHDDLHRWSLPKLRSLILESGLKIEKIRPMGGYYRMLGWQVSKLSYKIRKPKNPIFIPFYYLIKIPVGLIFQIIFPLILFSLDFLDKEKRDTCGYVVVAEK